jgi:hypothetical protein
VPCELFLLAKNFAQDHRKERVWFAMRPLSSSFASAIIVHRGVPATSPLRRVFAVSLALFFSFFFFPFPFLLLLFLLLLTPDYEYAFFFSPVL